jgi:hypothetical protein
MKKSKYLIVSLFAVLLFNSCKTPEPPPPEEPRLKIALDRQFVDLYVPYDEYTKQISLFFSNKGIVSENAVEITMLVQSLRSDTSLPNGTWNIIDACVVFDDGGRRLALYYGEPNATRAYLVQKGKLIITDEHIDIDVEAIYNENGYTLFETIERYRYEGKTNF